MQATYQLTLMESYPFLISKIGPHHITEIEYLVNFVMQQANIFNKNIGYYFYSPDILLRQIN